MNPEAAFGKVVRTLNILWKRAYRLCMELSRNEQPPYTIKNGNLVLKVKAFPKAGKKWVAGVRNGELMVRLQAPALKGQANKELVKLLAKSLGVPGSDIKILSGETSRHKLIGLPLTARPALEDIL
jgi:uncharacterized protein (TIGR00251 family)